MSEIELRDAILRHALQLQRLSAGEQAKVDEILRELEAELKLLLQSQTLSEAGKAEINALIRDAEKLIDPAYAKVAGTTDTHALALIVADKTVNALEDVLPLAIGKPSAETLASLTKDVLIDGAPSSAWWAKQSEDTAFKFAAAVRQGVINGETNERIVARIAGGRADTGILDIARRNARALVHSSVMSAANAARLATFRKNARLIAGVRWLSTLDSHTCLRCAALDGAAWNLDGKRLSGTKVDFTAPPLHWSCFPAGTAVLSRHTVTGASKRWFDGEVVVIKTAAGRELTCTPNHPVLTDRGWVAADLLDVGSNVVADVSSEREGRIDGDGEQVPASIHHVAEAFFASRQMLAMPVEVAAEDFHGDGRGGHVAIVWSDRLLESEFYASLLKKSRQLSLMRGGLAREVAFTSGRHLAVGLERPFAAFDGGVSRSDLGLALCPVHAAPLQPLGLGLAAAIDAVIAENAIDHDALKPELLCDGIAGDAGFVGAADGLIIDDGARSDWHAAMLQFAHDDGVRNAGLSADLSSIKPAEVELDTVIECRRVGFSDHVYNLENEAGWYTANGLVVHNCRCVLSAIPKSFRELGIDIPEPDDTGERASSQGPVPATTTMSDFLKRQPDSFVEQVLGKKRAAMFEAGKITLTDLVSGTGRELTLEELNG